MNRERFFFCYFFSSEFSRFRRPQTASTLYAVDSDRGENFIFFYCRLFWFSLRGAVTKCNADVAVCNRHDWCGNKSEIDLRMEHSMESDITFCKSLRGNWECITLHREVLCVAHVLRFHFCDVRTPHSASVTVTREYVRQPRRTNFEFHSHSFWTNFSLLAPCRGRGTENYFKLHN